jgi:hypothetical protein
VKFYKSRLAFIIFFILVSDLTTSGVAISYKVGVSRNNELIWKCKVCNQAELNNIFGTDWDTSGIFTNLSVGSKMKWNITSTLSNTTIKSITFDIWYWNLRVNWGIRDNLSQIVFPSNPEDFSDDMSALHRFSFISFWFPTPVGEYMGELNLNNIYDVDNRVLPTINIIIPKDGFSPGYPNKDITIIALYNDRGILSSYKLYSKGNRVIIDIALDYLPFYVIPTLVGLIIIFILGITYYIKKNRKLTTFLSKIKK